MEDPFIVRSLLFAVIEYGLAIYVLTKGKSYREVFAVILSLLATYQLGEFIYLYFQVNWGLQLAILATTFLPPLGVYLITRNVNHNWFFWFTFGAGSILGLILFMNPGVFDGAPQVFCLVKFISRANQSTIVGAWGIYYLGTLTISMIVELWNYFKAKDRNFRQLNGMMFLAYLTFFPASLIVVALSPELDLTDLTSLMCSFALAAAFIMAWTSFNVKEIKRS